MSVIKSTDGGLDTRVRALGTEASAPRPPQVDPVIVALRSEVESLNRALAAREEEVSSLRAEVDAARREGTERGREAGLKEGAARAEETLDRLQQGVDIAVEQFGREVTSMERLAAALAREGLRKVLGDSDEQGRLVTQIIQTQTAQLEAQAILCIEVSAEDFPDTKPLAGLAAQPGIRMEAISGLVSGACRIQLRLGALEVGLDQQWPRLSAILDDLAGSEASS